MNCDQRSLQQIVMEVWHSLLGLTLTPATSCFDSVQPVVASVEIRGERCTTIELFADEQLLAIVAEAMFDCDRASLSLAEIRDAFGEVANVIAGQVIADIDDVAELSLPIISEAFASPRHSHSDTRGVFECCGHRLTIALREYTRRTISMEYASALTATNSCSFSAHPSHNTGTPCVAVTNQEPS